ncbi:hypothetical protein I547_4561 [Mycobacterium kansasii 824]|uniref:Uncharacterized protein n=1 Tax=Mycobacterium kansasii TaxID=1768 RepID=A0A1V3WYD0_MYCKA|nr:hypothetical protein I547_4561 [Mycobacterium kansasii 824]KEP40487.1 hypothetical protein MKSMC1_43140 [Mycobacterium kansasii]OOK68121.1 hypothetical protein BZL29_7002 [Mycobacterium kansasii]OOK72053.1 hypothetical protein BZL30_5456 [Mycobacterium kansasii]
MTASHRHIISPEVKLSSTAERASSMATDVHPGIVTLPARRVYIFTRRRGAADDTAPRRP